MIFAEDILKKIVEDNSSIQTLRFIEFSMVPSIQQRFLPGFIQTQAIDSALEIRASLKLPFWDCLLSTQLNSKYFSKEIIKEAGFHNSTKSEVSLSRSEIPNLLRFFERDKHYGINSKVITSDGNTLHLPLLDFHISSEEENLPCVEQVLQMLNVKGYILQTNKSFHFYGTQLMEEYDFITFLSKSLLYSPIIDKNWIAHQLIERSATLRITSKDGKSPLLVGPIG